MAELAHVRTSALDIGYEHSGAADGPVVVLLHGYPFDVRAFDGVVPIVNAGGFRTIVPYLRGYGPTRFLSPDTPRSGEQAALGMDLLELLDALQIRQAILAGFDWGGRAACVVSALWPERSLGLVTCTGYQIQDIANSDNPTDPEQERRFWYQFYFNTERGREGSRPKARRDKSNSRGSSGRPTGISIKVRIVELRNPSTTPISLMSWSTHTGIAFVMPLAILVTLPSRRGWQPCPRSAFRRL